MFGSIPELRTILQEKLIVAQPIVRQTIALAYDNMSAIVIPLAGKVIGKPILTLNGKNIKLDTTNDFSLTHGQSLTAEQIDKILAAANSPAKGTGKDWLKYGIEYDIDAAYGIAIFYQESTLGTNENWYKAGYNTGNIICAGYWKCHGRFRDYSQDVDPWASSIRDEMTLLKTYRDSGIKTYDEAIMKWAPPSENNTTGYIAVTKELISQWRSTNKNIMSGDIQSLSTPITEDKNSDFGFNVNYALNANNNALRGFMINDGERWSFNETIGKVDSNALKVIYGIPGAGWCDLACRYIQVFKGLGLEITHGTDINSNDMVFLQHGGIALNNCSIDESPYIWSAGNMGFDNGMQDLVINNRTGKTIHIIVIDNEDDTATIAGKLQ